MLTDYEIFHINQFRERWLKIHKLHGTLDTFILVILMVLGTCCVWKTCFLPATYFWDLPIWAGPVLIAVEVIATLLFPLFFCYLITLFFYCLYQIRCDRLIVKYHIGDTGALMIPGYLAISYMGELNLTDKSYWFYLPVGNLVIPFRT